MPVFPSIDHRHDVGHVTFVDHMTVIFELFNNIETCNEDISILSCASQNNKSFSSFYSFFSNGFPCAVQLYYVKFSSKSTYVRVILTF